jgi:RNA polymerase sigma-70 factor, ECF subfamily
MSVHEVAEALGVPVGTVKARLSRGRAMLATLLSDAEPETTPTPSGQTPNSPTTNSPVAPPANPPRRKSAPDEQEVRDAG